MLGFTDVGAVWRWCDVVLGLDELRDWRPCGRLLQSGTVEVGSLGWNKSWRIPAFGQWQKRERKLG